jgi:oligosaccharyltransferase complex subunit alpha (ribophorin I)
MSSGATGELNVVPDKVFASHPNVSVHRANIPPMSPGSTVTVVVEVMMAHALPPFPKEITQNERQLIQYTGSAYLVTPYPSTTQSTIITLPSATIESFSRVSPTSSSENVLTYGPYSNVAPFSSSRITVHYENNGPYIVVAELERVIEVSHWGNVAVEEHVHILHEGENRQTCPFPYMVYHCCYL